MSERETGRGGITSEVLKYLRTLPASRWFKIVGHARQEPGIPDIVGCLRGYFVAIETKAPDGNPTPLQSIKLKELTEAQGVVGVATCLEDAKAIIALVPEEPVRISYFDEDIPDW